MYVEMHHVGGEADAGLSNSINGTSYTNRHTSFKKWVNEYV